MKTFPVLLSVQHDFPRKITPADRRHGHPRDVAAGRYEPGARPQDDRLVPAETLVESASSPSWTSSGVLSFIDEDSTRFMRQDGKASREPFPALLHQTVLEACWSPDGRTLACVTWNDEEGRRLQVGDPERAMRPVDLPHVQPCHVGWLPDGGLLLSHLQDGHGSGLTRLAPEPAHPAETRPAHAPPPTWGTSLSDGSVSTDRKTILDAATVLASRISPEGRRVAWVRPGEQGLDLCIVDLDDGTVHPLFVDLPWQHVEHLTWLPDGSRIIASIGRTEWRNAQFEYVPEIWTFAPDGSAAAVVTRSNGVVSADAKTHCICKEDYVQL